MSQGQLSALLGWLAPEVREAGAQYEHLRTRLIGLFAFWGSRQPETAADETFTRVAAKLSQGEEVRTPSRLAYLRGVARYVFLEELRAHEKERVAHASTVPEAPEPESESAGERARCLTRCLGELDPDTRTLVLTYYQGQERERIDRRKRLADQLGIGVVPLRNRMQRLREKLRACTETCLCDTDSPRAPLLTEARQR